MSDPVKVLGDKIAQFRLQLANIPDAVIPSVVSALADEQTKTIAAGQDAYGSPWTPKKKADGAFTFVKPEDIQVGAVGRIVFIRIKSRVPVLHHFGYAKGNIARGVIPSGRMPSAWSKRILDIANRAFREAAA